MSSNTICIIVSDYVLGGRQLKNLDSDWTCDWNLFKLAVS